MEYENSCESHLFILCVVTWVAIFASGSHWVFIAQQQALHQTFSPANFGDIFHNLKDNKTEQKYFDSEWTIQCFSFSIGYIHKKIDSFLVVTGFYWKICVQRSGFCDFYPIHFQIINSFGVCLHSSHIFIEHLCNIHRFFIGIILLFAVWSVYLSLISCHGWRTKKSR